MVWVLFTLNLVVAVGRFQPNVLSTDQWDFFRPMFEGRGWMDLFLLQHGPHRQGLAFVLTSWVMKAANWDARADSLWVASLLSFSALLALRLKWKLTGTLQFRDAWIPIVGLTLAQFETLVIMPNASHSAFPLMLTLVLANAWLSPRPALRYLGGGLGAVILAFTGFGLFAGAVLTVLLAAAATRHVIGREWAHAELAATGTAIAIVGWISFGSGYVFSPAVAGFRFPWTPAFDYLRFIALMLVYPAGVEGESMAHYLAGAAIAVSLFGITASVAWKWIRATLPDTASEVILLLLGAGVLFVCNTAIGRIPNGITAGMVSRYVTLIFPLWLGAYLFAATNGRRSLVLAVTIALWCIAVWPFRQMAGRPLMNWPGTLGATRNQYILTESVTTGKAAWVDTYLKTGSWEQAQTEVGTYVYPWPKSTHLQEKLEFLRQHRLSFFAGHAGPADFLPLFLNQRVIWNDRFPTGNVPQSLDRDTRLTYIARLAGFVTIPIDAPSPNFDVVVTHGTGVQNCPIAKLPATLVLPVEGGFNRFALSVDPAARAATGPLRWHAALPDGAIALRVIEKRASP